MAELIVASISCSVKHLSNSAHTFNASSRIFNLGPVVVSVEDPAVTSPLSLAELELELELNADVLGVGECHSSSNIFLIKSCCQCTIMRAGGINSYAQLSHMWPQGAGR